MNPEDNPFSSVLPPELAGQLHAAAPNAFTPAVLQPLISHGNVDVSVLFRPADFISGDMYDLRVLDENHLGIYVADATGHSVSAALLNVFLRRAIELEAQAAIPGKPPLEAAALLSRLNKDLVDLYNDECQFIAMVYAVVNTQTGTVEFARAGLPHPILRRQQGTIEIKPVYGTVTGLFEESEYTSCSAKLQTGDTLAIYTDGIEELMLEQRAQAVADAPDQWILQTTWCEVLATQGPEVAARWLCEKLEASGGSLQSSDDVTLLAITCRPNG